MITSLFSLIYNYIQVRLAETFLGIAEALRKPRGFLFATRGSKALK